MDELLKIILPVFVMEKTYKYQTAGRGCSCSSGGTGCNTGVSGSPESMPEDEREMSAVRMFMPAAISLALLLIALVLDHLIAPQWFTGWVRMVWYAVAYLPVGLPVLREAVESISKGDVFSEFFLMGIATTGAFAIGQYPEGVAVMLFYAVGEIFQTMAVNRAEANIRTLLDQRPDEVTIVEDNMERIIKAESVAIGDVILLRPGEKLGLDGELLSDRASFNTSALTGESKPAAKKKGETVLAGMINLNTVCYVKVSAAYADSKLSRILELVRHSSARKATTELFIRKFARIYTPVVVFLAIGITLLPYFFVGDYLFSEWLYRALIFLVISCPCALVISIPLGYFGGIGAAGRNGILVKGGNFLDILARVQHVVLDKTGTVTEGVFEVQGVAFRPDCDQGKMIRMVNALESKSTHPVATAIRHFAGAVDPEINLSHVEELPGYGLRAMVNGKVMLVGNFRLLDREGIVHDGFPEDVMHTLIAVAYDNRYVGYLSIADRIKPDAKQTVDRLRAMHIDTTMLSGDKDSVVQSVAGMLGIDSAFGDLLPEDKVEKVKGLKTGNTTIAFVGDGVNDAPAVALSDVGIAMGGLGSDAAIETADVVIQDDEPGKIPMAVSIGKQTRKIVWQNIIMAFAVKLIVLALGAGGLATMWEAVFADVGVALLAIFNAVRIQRMDFQRDCHPF